MPIYEVRQSLTTVVGLASNHPLGITNFCQAHALSLSLSSVTVGCLLRMNSRKTWEDSLSDETLKTNWDMS